jgi:aspartate aminotransferase
LAGIPALKIFPPEGAFYVFFDVSAYLGKAHAGKALRTSLELCEYLLEAQLLATVPGSAFGLEGFVRISFACDLALLGRALDRLEAGLQALS